MDEHPNFLEMEASLLLVLLQELNRIYDDLKKLIKDVLELLANLNCIKAKGE